MFYEKALVFADKAHRGQIRKFKFGEPYITHLLRVTAFISEMLEVDDDHTLTVAMLHDTIEDCNVIYQDILIEFNEAIAKDVQTLTKPNTGNKNKNEELYLEQLSKGSNVAKLVKLADRWDNLRSTMYEDCPVRFAQSYIANTKGLLQWANQYWKISKNTTELFAARALVKAMLFSVQSKYGHD